jgi:dTMP kinase
MRYIVFEGVDGSGKTTLAKMLYDRLPDPKVFTKEPGSPHSDFCMGIRSMILDGAAQDISKHTYAYLFAADREEHMRRVVVPSLKEGKWVVSDRSVVSDWAYRPYHGNHVRRRHTRLFNKLNPVVFYVKVLVDTAVERMTARGALNEFEKAHVIDKIEDLQHAYERVAFEKLADNIHVGIVDNNKSLEDAWYQIEALLMGDELYEYLQRL